VNKCFVLSLLCLITAVLATGCQTSTPLRLASTGEGQPAATPPAITNLPPTEDLPPAKTPTPINPVLGDRKTRATDWMEMVFVPGGEFVMGSDETEVGLALEQCKAYGANCAYRYFSVEMPMHLIYLDSFWIDKTEVTSRQYQQCVLEGLCQPAGCSSDGDEYPVVCVTWNQAAAYCRWAGARLPTEAEWEYTARGQERFRYPWGNEFEGTLLNYCDASCILNKRDAEFDDGYAESAPVASYPQGASWVGALDMAGNVWEMVADWNGNYPGEAQFNPTGPETGSRRVARGGSWHASPDHVRSALRTHMGPDDSSDHAGYRCAQSSTGN
jgi:formylglycine-generating enzyme required for sulfatase activity